MKPTHAGFTFIEMVIAIMVVGLVVGGLTAALSTVLTNPNQNRELLMAQHILQGMTEQLLMERRTTSVGFSVYGYSSFTSAFTNSALNGLTFTRTVNISFVNAGFNGCPPGAPVSTCKLVTLTVSAPNSAAVQANLLFTSY